MSASTSLPSSTRTFMSTLNSISSMSSSYFRACGHGQMNPDFRNRRRKLLSQFLFDGVLCATTIGWDSSGRDELIALF